MGVVRCRVAAAVVLAMDYQDEEAIIWRRTDSHGAENTHRLGQLVCRPHLRGTRRLMLVCVSDSH
jgi:hypothetical protein